MVEEAGSIRLWDDNPTAIDMLGFGPVVHTVVAAVCSPALDPVTVALQSSWGGGKSTALRLVEKELVATSGVVVVRCDPWEYDDLPKSEIRNLVIGQVLNVLSTADTGFKDRAAGILKRIGWAKVGAAVTNMVLARTVDVEKLVEVFTPQADEPRSMAGFRDEFAELVRDTPDLKKVVVLIDDLDRCSPDSVVAILEAVKVFLAVPKLAFVVAAEEALIRFAIELSTNAGARTNYSDRYLEKIVQIPVRLPTLSRDDAETYIGLLLTQHRNPGAQVALVEHVADRRSAGIKPYLGGDFPLGSAPEGRDLKLAAQVAAGLSHDRWSSPRAIKRFLNAWGVRVAIAEASGTELDLDVMLKLYVLEDRFPKSFETLVKHVPEDRGELLSQWETWARAENEKSPDGVDEDTRAWAAAPPSLADIYAKIDTYLTVAATFTSVSAGAGLPSDVLEALAGLLSDVEAVRRGALNEVRERELPIRAALITRLLERAGATNSAIAIESAKEVANTDSELHMVFHEAMRQHALPFVTADALIDIAAVGDPRETLEALLNNPSVAKGIRPLVVQELKELDGRGAG